VWDGQDKMLRDDVTWIRAITCSSRWNIQNNFNYHTPPDNGSSINNQIV